MKYQHQNYTAITKEDPTDSSSTLHLCYFRMYQDFSQKQDVLKSQFWLCKKGCLSSSSRHQNVEATKVNCFAAFKIKVLLKSPVFEKAEHSGPVEAEMLGLLCRPFSRDSAYQFQIPARKKKTSWFHCGDNTQCKKFVFI